MTEEKNDGAVTSIKIAREVSRKSKILLPDVKIVADLIFKEMADSILKEKRVRIKDFGTFHFKVCHERYGHNPKEPSGTRILIPKHFRLKFTPCGPIRDAIKAMVPK